MAKKWYKIVPFWYGWIDLSFGWHKTGHPAQKSLSIGPSYNEPKQGCRQCPQEPHRQEDEDVDSALEEGYNLHCPFLNEDANSALKNPADKG